MIIKKLRRNFTIVKKKKLNKIKALSFTDIYAKPIQSNIIKSPISS